MCKAVLYLFRYKIYHCDIKPVNAVFEEEISEDDDNVVYAKCKLIDAGSST